VTYDRAAIMGDAHKRFRDSKRLGLGWTFGQCLSTAWAAAKARAALAEAEMARGSRLLDSATRKRRSAAKPHSAAFAGPEIASQASSL
jgi:hypothetical protein